MTERPTHLDVLRISHAARAAAVDGDVDRLHDTLCELRNALVLHGSAEDVQHATIAPAERVAAEGRRRLLDMLTTLLFTVDAGADDCSCIVRAAEVEVALRRQAKLEATVDRAARQL